MLPLQVLVEAVVTATEAAAVPFIIVSVLLFAVDMLTQARLLVMTTVIASVLLSEL